MGKKKIFRGYQKKNLQTEWNLDHGNNLQGKTGKKSTFKYIKDKRGNEPEKKDLTNGGGGS